MRTSLTLSIALALAPSLSCRAASPAPTAADVKTFLASENETMRALAQAAGCTTPLHRCSIYESKEAGSKLIAMLSLGQSRPWQDALETLTGSRQMDATAILDYFAPLRQWLDQQTKGKPVGW